jgi:hypothetical protein
VSPKSQSQGNTYGSWTDCGGLRGQTHIRSVIDATGRHAVLKKARRKSTVWLARFEEEARGMAALTAAGQSGVLPILDVDPSDPPQWFVMPQAEMLSERLGPFPDLSEVVAAVAHLTST